MPNSNYPFYYFAIPTINALAWIYPAFRQYKSLYQNYFIVTSLVAFISILGIFSWVRNAEIMNYYLCIVSSIQFLSLFDNKEIKNKWYLFILFFVALFFLMAIFGLYHAYQKLGIIVLIIHTLIALTILSRMIKDAKENLELNFFYITFLTYEITIIFQFLQVIPNTLNGVIYFYLLLSFQTILPFYFCYYRVDSPKFVIKIKNKNLENK